MAVFFPEDIVSRYQIISSPGTISESNDFSLIPPSSHDATFPPQSNDLIHDATLRVMPPPGVSVYSSPYHTAAETRARDITRTRLQLAKLWLEDFEATARGQREAQAQSAHGVDREDGFSNHHIEPVLNTTSMAAGIDDVVNPYEGFTVTKEADDIAWPTRLEQSTPATPYSNPEIYGDLDGRKQPNSDLTWVPPNMKHPHENADEFLGESVSTQYQDKATSGTPDTAGGVDLAVKPNQGNTRRGAIDMFDDAPKISHRKIKRGRGAKVAKKHAKTG